ncbi:hypothetical protein SLE2022_021500 [Rubroshorea leprosula]
MEKDNEVSAMEIEDPNSEQIITKFSINVFRLLKSAQMQHGLPHGDYTRYRYCTARLRRAITESTVTEARFLHVVLYVAERAWTHAMGKRQLPDGPNARQRICLIGRLRKAVKWASLFSHLCAIKGDSRTSLEADAYASYMKGSLLFEQDQNWDTALMHFKSARAVYEELGKYGGVENQVLCRERVEELEPSIRYWLHKIGESNLQTSELLQIGEMEGPALDLFKAKLDAVMAISNIQCKNSCCHFKSSRTGEAYHEARSCIHSDLATAGNAENVKDDLNGLDKAHRDDKNEKVTKPEELVRLYDLLLQNTADLSDLVSSGRDRKPEEVTFLKNVSLKFWLSEQKGASTWLDHRKLQSHNDSDQMMIKELKTLYNECRSKICIGHETGIQDEEKAPENLSKKMSTISLNGADKKMEKYFLGKLDVYESAVGDSNTKGAAPRIEAFPPPFESITRSPIIMDLAHDFISFPSLDNRMKKDKKGFISRFWC